MKVVFAVLLTLVNAALCLYFAYQGYTLIGKVNPATWVGALLPIGPFLLTAWYGLRPGSRALWNWGFSANLVVLALALMANVVDSGTSGSFSTWSVTAPFAALSLLNVVLLFVVPPRPADKAAAHAH